MVLAGRISLKYTRPPILNALEHNPGAHDVFQAGSGIFQGGFDDLEAAPRLEPLIRDPRRRSGEAQEHEPHDERSAAGG